MNIDSVLEMQLQATLGPMIIVAHQKEIRFNCPFCKDKDWHLYVGYRKDKGWICQKCRKHGKDVNSLLSSLGLTRTVSTERFFEIAPDLVSGIGQSTYRIAVGDEEPIEYVPLPRHYTPICDLGEDAGPFYNYLVNKRCLTFEELSWSKAGIVWMGDKTFFPSDMMLGRIIFPDPSAMLTIGGAPHSSYYVARGIRDQKPKYLNPPATQASTRVWNSRATGFKDRVIVEGVLSGIRTGQHAVALYGKECSSRQFEILLSMNALTYYVALDPDALTYSVSLCESLYLAGRLVRLVRIPNGKDPGDLGRARMAELCEDAESYTPNLRLKVLAESV